MEDSRFTSSTIDRSKPISFMITGSGGSAAVPVISCVTDPLNACACCRDAMPGGSGDKSKNKRGNTGGILRIPQIGGGEAIVLIDCGKTFREQAIRWFPQAGLRRIDALILTHHHADATGGLDDLRAWTNKAVIERTIPIYCSRVTYQFVAESSPYLVDKNNSSGGGSVPSFEWHIMPEDQDWEICGVDITPLPVHHGVYFNKAGRPPLICLGFLFDSSLLYMSDVNYIPEEIWSLLSRKLSLPSQTGSYSSKSLPRLQALIIDTMGLRAGPSHFGLPQAIETARRSGARRTYFTDISHQHSHASYLAFSLAFEKHSHSLEAKKLGLDKEDPPPLWKVRPESQQDQPPWDHVYEGIDFKVEDLELYKERALEAVEEWAGGVGPGLWSRPSRDGMTICWTDEHMKESWSRRRVWDDEYH
ncbi:hypothetical protein JCM5350_007681 [Sporobolomyces pararoseus]